MYYEKKYIERREICTLKSKMPKYFKIKFESYNINYFGTVGVLYFLVKYFQVLSYLPIGSTYSVGSREGKAVVY